MSFISEENSFNIKKEDEVGNSQAFNVVKCEIQDIKLEPTDTDNEDSKDKFPSYGENDTDEERLSMPPPFDIISFKTEAEDLDECNSESISTEGDGIEDQNEQVLFCNICKKPYSPGLKPVHREYSFSNKICQECASEGSSVDTHQYLSIPSPILPHKNIVGNTFSDSSVNEKLFPCAVCNKTFSEKIKLTEHERIHSCERPHSCQTCNRAFARKKHLKRHMRIHSGERPYSCEMCEKSFSFGEALVRHVRSHTGERPYSCEVCEKCFSSKSDVTRHMRCHTGERPYCCNVCNKSFTQAANVTQHMRIHTNERPFSCELCNKTFSHKAGLTQHTRVHTNERPFSCHLCTKKFCQIAGLKRHVRRHTGERPYRCGECDKSFTSKDNLCNHLRIHRADHQST